MSLKASRADPGSCHIILNSHCCQRTPFVTKVLDGSGRYSIGGIIGKRFVCFSDASCRLVVTKSEARSPTLHSLRRGRLERRRAQISRYRKLKGLSPAIEENGKNLFEICEC